MQNPMTNLKFDDRGTFNKDGKKYGYYEVNGKRFEWRKGSKSKQLRALKKAMTEKRKRG